MAPFARRLNWRIHSRLKLQNPWVSLKSWAARWWLHQLLLFRAQRSKRDVYLLGWIAEVIYFCFDLLGLCGVGCNAFQSNALQQFDLFPATAAHYSYGNSDHITTFRAWYSHYIASSSVAAHAWFAMNAWCTQGTDFCLVGTVAIKQTYRDRLHSAQVRTNWPFAHLCFTSCSEELSVSWQNIWLNCRNKKG